LTASYSPQQNGVAERKNGTILDMVLSMMKSKNMPKEFGQKSYSVPFIYKIGVHMQG